MLTSSSEIGYSSFLFANVSIKSLSLFKKLKAALEQKFVSTRDVDLNDCTASVDTITAFKRKLGQLDY